MAHLTSAQGCLWRILARAVWYALLLVQPAMAAPIVVLSTGKTDGVVPLDVHFNASQSSSPNAQPLRFTWAFGDDGEAEGAEVDHRYVTVGDFVAQLMVTDASGARALARVLIHVQPRNTPRAAFSVRPALATDTYVFDLSFATGDRPLANFELDFGDGSAPWRCAQGPQSDGTRPPATSAHHALGMRFQVPGSGGLHSTASPSADPHAGGTGTRPPSGTTGGSASGGLSDPPRCSTSVTHRYASPGSYAVTLSVRDTAGRRDAMTRQLVIPRGAAAPTSTLQGVTGGAPAGTAVARVSLSEWAQATGSTSLRTIVILDQSDPLSGDSMASGPHAGTLVDAVILGGERCTDAVCVAYLPREVPEVRWHTRLLHAEDEDPASTDEWQSGWVSLPAFLRMPQSPPLFGTQGREVDEAAATLSVLDANATASSPRGHVALGMGGVLSLQFDSAVDVAGRWLYIGTIAQAGRTSTVLIYEDQVDLDRLFDLAFVRAERDAAARAGRATPRLVASDLARLRPVNSVLLQAAGGQGVRASVIVEGHAASAGSSLSLHAVEPGVAPLMARTLQSEWSLVAAGTRTDRRPLQWVFDRPPGRPLSPASRAFSVQENGQWIPLSRQRFSHGRLTAQGGGVGRVVLADIDRAAFLAHVNMDVQLRSVRSASDAVALAERVQTMLEYAAQASALGLEEQSEAALDEAAGVVQSALLSALAQPAGSDPCGDDLVSVSRLIESAQRLGLETDAVGQLAARQQGLAEQCLTGGTIDQDVQAWIADCAPVAFAQQPYVSFTRVADGLYKATGSALEEFTLACPYLMLTADATFGLTASGKLAAGVLDFEPFTFQFNQGSMLAVGPGAVVRVAWRDGVYRSSLCFELGCLQQSGTLAPATEDVGHAFTPYEGSVSQRVSVSESGIGSETLTLHTRCPQGDSSATPPEGEIQATPAGWVNQNQELAVGRKGIQFTINGRDVDCQEGRRVSDRLDPDRTAWHVSGMDTPLSTIGSTLSWDSLNPGRTVISARIDDAGVPVDDAPVDLPGLELTAVLPSEVNASEAGTGWVGTAHQWRSTLMPGRIHFGGLQVRERLDGEVMDECHDKVVRKLGASAYPPVTSLGSGAQIWTVAADNTWGPDTHWMDSALIDYYRSQGAAPCAIRAHQTMEIVDGDRSWPYAATEIEYTIGVSTLRSKRHGVVSETPYPNLRPTIAR